jgi:quercetin dioxygenase-like cupin family protein
MSFHASTFRAAALSLLLAAPVLAQDETPVPVDPPPPISRSVLQTTAVADSGMDVVMVRVDLAPNVTVGRHTHPGPVSAYVQYGSIEVSFDGTDWTRYAAGESFSVPANTVHDERTGAAGARVVASFVAPAGAPLATPAE